MDILWQIAIATIIVTILGYGMTLLIKLIEAKTGKEKLIHICPLDREGYISMVKDIKGVVEKCQDKVGLVHSDLEKGIVVAKRNTDHYEEFVKTLAELTNHAKNQTKLLDQLVGLSQRQTELLIGIKRNGNGSK